MLAPIKQVDTEPEGITQEELSEFVNMLKVIRIDRTRDQGRTQEEHAKMYVPTLVKTEPGATEQASIMMALLDSGNLLAHMANKQELEIRGVSPT